MAGVEPVAEAIVQRSEAEALGVTAATRALEDAEVVARCREGDREAFARLVAKYQDRVFNACLRVCGHRDDAADLTQEAFLRALASIERFGDRAGFYTWVFRIAMNLAIDRGRRRKRHGERSLDNPGRRDTGGGYALRIESRTPPPSHGLDQEEQQAAVAAALERLEPDHRAVIVLRDIEDCDYAEIAEVLEIPIGTVKSRLFRARVALRELLAPILDRAG